jgi:hypothetical protein
MNRTRLGSVLTMCAMLLAGPMTATSSQGPAPAAFDLPAPTGPYAIGTTSWHVTDRSRHETFAGPGEFRQVEVRPVSGDASGGAVAPYLREGCRSSALCEVVRRRVRL